LSWYFRDDFRKSFKEANPDSKGVKEVAKEGGEKWKSMTDEEKKPYQDKAAELKAEYEKALEGRNAENEDDEKETEEIEEKQVEEITEEE
uniref:HMG box domain-containing protein n=1 Tax=Cucumis melo TaxID=3656 RepID=A0A9I9EIL3_CUCME